MNTEGHSNCRTYIHIYSCFKSVYYMTMAKKRPKTQVCKWTANPTLNKTVIPLKLDFHDSPSRSRAMDFLFVYRFWFWFRYLYNKSLIKIGKTECLWKNCNGIDAVLGMLCHFHELYCLINWWRWNWFDWSAKDWILIF